MPLPRSIASLCASSLFALCACVGTIERTPAEQTSVRTDAQTLEDVSAPPIVEGGAPPESEDTIPVTTRFYRLTHGQWEATTRDLLRLPEGSGLSSMFTPDAPSGTFDNNGSELRIGQQLWSDQQAAAEALARRVARDPARLAAIVPADAPMEPRARARATIARFGLRAFRRPLAEDEVNAHLAALYDRGASLLGGEAFAAGIELVLRAMLQSPHFLYRVEASDRARDGRVPLDDWELASRLSYALWGTMPDDALFEAAGRGELTDREGLRAQARRMLASPRAHAAVRAFHGQLYEWERFADVRRDPTRFPAWRETLPASMLREAELFVDDTVFAARAGLRRLLTAEHTFVDADLARVYGLTGSFDQAFRRVDLDRSQRRGILTQAGFLASRAYAADPDPIHRGVAINVRLLCATLPSPPSMIPALPMVAPGRTNRQTVEAHTGVGTCGAACHATLINPIGFAFERYDSVGAYRTTDRGFSVDSSGEYPLDGRATRFADALALSDALADSRQTHECYARYWLEYLAGRGPQPEDRPLIARIGERSRADEPVLALIESIVASPTFTARSAAVEVMR